MAIAAETRTLRLPHPLLTSISRAIAADRSPRDAAVLLRQAGYDAGRSFFEYFENWAPDHTGESSVRALPAPQFWNAFRDFWDFLGWGMLEHRQIHEGVAVLESADWIEAEPDGVGAGTGCHLSTGLLADFLSRIAGEDVAVMEIECRARGAERCRFLIGSPQTLTTLYQEVEQGRTFDDALAGLA